MGRGHLNDLSVGVRVIKTDVKEIGCGAWTGVILLRLGTSDGMLCTR
jgi:hypothetical protein